MNNTGIQERIRTIISKYYVLDVCKALDYSFTPLCIIKVGKNDPTVDFDKMQNEFKAIGFRVKFSLLTKKEYSKYDLIQDEQYAHYFVLFEAEDFNVPMPTKRTRSIIIQIVLIIATTITVYVSAIFYISFIEPYYGDYGNLSLKTVISISSFCFGMVLIIVIHEFGHIFFSRRHHLKTSLPYLIPGPPPLGMLGAFVSIKDDPSTRNQKFDVAIGGIILGMIISSALVIIGFLFSEQIDTNLYIQFMASYTGRTTAEEAQNVSQHLNWYNLLFLGIRMLFFRIPPTVNLFGQKLPQQLLVIHPLTYAGWIGLLLSGLNLIPISFQDGGHLLKSIFPGRFTKLIGMLIAIIIWLLLDIQLWMFAFLGFPGAIRDLSPDQRPETVPNPILPLTRSRIVVAVCFIGFFIILWPLSFDRLIFGISY
jgi:Zn-dependent protease